MATIRVPKGLMILLFACVCLRVGSTTCLIRVYYSTLAPTIHSLSLFTDVVRRERSLSLSLSISLYPLGPTSYLDHESGSPLKRKACAHAARHSLAISTRSFNNRGARFRWLFERRYLKHSIVSSRIADKMYDRVQWCEFRLVKNIPESFIRIQLVREYTRFFHWAQKINFHRCHYSLRL